MDATLAGKFSSSMYVSNKQRTDDVDSKYGSNSKPAAQRKTRKKKGRGIPLDMVFPRNPNEEDEGFDILNPYYESKRPPPENFCTNDEDFPLLSEARKHTLTLHADDLINRTVDFYATNIATPNLLIRSMDMKSLNAGGNPLTVYREKLERHSKLLMDIKVFPRHNFLVARFADVHDSVLAYNNLNNQMLYTHKMYCSYLKQFPSREAILQHKRRLQEAASNPKAKTTNTSTTSSTGPSSASTFPPLTKVNPASDIRPASSQTPTSASSYSSSGMSGPTASLSTASSFSSTTTSSAAHQTVEDFDCAAEDFLNSFSGYREIEDYDTFAEDFLNSLL